MLHIKGLSVWGIAALAAFAMQARAQNAVVSGIPPTAAVKAATPAGDVTVRLQALERNPELLIVLATECMAPEDYDAAKKLIASAQKPVGLPMRFALFRSGAPLEISGPFRSAAELQQVLRKLKPAEDVVACPAAAAFFPALIAALAPEPSEWGYTLAVGRMPAFDPKNTPEPSAYAAAWAIRKCIARKRTLLFEDLSGAPSTLTDSISKATGAPDGWTVESLASAGPIESLTWDAFPLRRGFDLQTVRFLDFPPLASMPFLATSPEATLPGVANYAEMRAAVERIQAMRIESDADAQNARAALQAALAVNPSDRDAVSLSIKLAARLKDVAGEVALLETAAELNPADAALWSRMGELQFAAGNMDEAERALLRARERGASSAAASERLGRIAIAKKDLPRALDYMGESLKLDPRQQDLWFFTADLAGELRRGERRIECLESGLKLGDRLPRRTELIRIYLAKNDLANAARHADLELPSLPRDVQVQTTWAGFYEKLSRPDDALKRWRTVIEIDPKVEPAHFAICSILFGRKLYPDALEAAERGLDADPKSARLELVKVDSLEVLNRVYDARRSLDVFAPESSDPQVLKREAEFTDRYGGNAPQAWKRYAEALPESAADRAEVYRRGAAIAAREGDQATWAWFQGKLTKPTQGGSAAPQSATTKATTWIPGGIDALSFIAGGQPDIAPDRFLTDYCRRIVARASGNPQELVLFQKQIAAYFEELRQLLAAAPRNGSRAVLTLSLNGKQAQEQTQRVLNLFGWRLVHSKEGIAVQSSEKKEKAANQDLASALAVDQQAMQSAFRKGAAFEIEIPWDEVPILFDEATWRSAAHADKLAGGIAEALAQTPDLARAYLGLSSVDRFTASVLTADFGLGSKYAELLANYSSALGITNGHAAVPGGAAAEPLWARLTGAPPSDPARFFRALFEKDQGRLLIWFFQLSQLDAAHQRFFTASAHRMDAFYEAFSQSDDVRGRAGKLSRANGFSDFLRSIPLQGNSVLFPGSPAVWMVTNGRRVDAQKTAKMMKKVREVATPDVEDEILLRLARLHEKQEDGGTSETAAFLAVARIDEHRNEPLDEQSALILAQNYNEYRTLYPYFSEFRSLTAADLQNFFGALARMRQLDDLHAEAALGPFEALLELLRLAQTSGMANEEKTARILRAVCAAFNADPDAAGYATASLDAVRELIREAPKAKDANAALAEALLGHTAPVEVEWKGVESSLDVGPRRELAYARVLNLQKIPEIALLLRMDETARKIGAGAEPALPLAEALLRDAQAIPTVEVPKTVKFEGHAKQSIQKYSPLRLQQAATELRADAAKKKVNPKDLQKRSRDVLEEMAPQVRLALAGAVYAVHLDPGDLLAENDPLLVRKHQAFDLSPASSRRARFPASALQEASAGEGSFFMGSFAQFALAAAGARSGARKGVNAALLTNQIASIRMTPWASWTDADQRLLGAKLRVTREWCVRAAADPAALAALSEDTLGLLSLTRRRQLLDSLAAHRWQGIAENLTLSDQLTLADRYLARYEKSPWDSPADGELRRLTRDAPSDTALDSLGPLPASLYGCSHPHLVALAPYEEYEHHLFPGEMAERTAELKIYLGAALDRAALPAAAMPAIADEVAKRAFGAMRMADERDWASALKAFASIDEKTIGAAIEAAGGASNR